MQLKAIDIDLHLKVPGLLLEIRARLLGRVRCIHEKRIRAQKRRDPAASGKMGS